jgi:glycosyltransferase involved in cell wall biosynthesis
MPDSKNDSRLRIAVYTIARNEEQHAIRFMDSIVDEADLVVVLDTGSTDRTVALLENKGAVVHQASVSPFRFDMARNTALALVPADIDICISLDLDEVLTPGWRAAIEACWKDEATRLHYRYIWNWTSEGEPGTVFHSDKIHARFGYRWKHPVHEVLSPEPGYEEKIITCGGFTLEHHADHSKSRGQYLELLEMSVSEDPEDGRNSHYLTREYSFHGRWDQVLHEGQRHLSLKSATWHKERAKTMRLLAQAHRQKGELGQARGWLYRAISEDPSSRENYLDLGETCLASQDYQGAYYFARSAQSLTEQEMSYMVDESAWSWKPHDIIGVASYYLGNLDEALENSRRACELNPNDDRLTENLRLIEDALGLTQD